MNISRVLLSLTFGFIACTVQGKPPSPINSYVVIVSEETARDPAWAPVVNTLRKKYNGAAIVYPTGQVEECIDALKHLRPRYAAFVVRPEEAGRSFVVTLHRMTRQLDDDPYTDLRWGIVTGYDASDALRAAKRSEPLVVRSIATSMGPKLLDHYDHGFASDETNVNVFWTKAKEEIPQNREVTPDPAQAYAEAFNTRPPDLFQTSGHATEKDWQICYNIPGGSFRCENGQLFGKSTDGKRYDINSPHPKIYMPTGNCLIGHIPGPDCMATAWMHSGGVLQMFGYTAVTFHGYMGWGIQTYFNNEYTLSESFFYNNQALLWELQKLFPDQAQINFENYDLSNLSGLAKKYNIKGRTLLGHLWDRDTVAFYGDPAWKAHLPQTDPAWTTTYSHEGENVTVEIRVLKDGTWGNRPLAIPFPERLGGIRLVSCTPTMDVLVTDDFALLSVIDRPRKAGDTIQLRFGAHTLDDPPTLDGTPAIHVSLRTKKTPPLSVEIKTEGLSTALRFAGKNRTELEKALSNSEGLLRTDTAFLIANMPIRDLRKLDADFLIENVTYARKALDESPWKERITEELYREYILPYANLSETREPWRKTFHEQLKPMVEGIDDPGQAAIKLNGAIYDHFNVHYHATKRPRPDQSPSESIAASYASCTGLSILLVDACRSVGIPSRIAGVAQWTGSPGNHTWVEIWDGQWHCIGAAESTALDDIWFAAGTAKADASNPLRRVYAVKFSRDTLHFPMVWNPYANEVNAVDVTAQYKKQFKKTP